MNGVEFLAQCRESYFNARAMADLASVNPDTDPENPGALRAELTEGNAPAVTEALAVAAGRLKVWVKVLNAMKDDPGLLLTELGADFIAEMEAAAKDGVD